MSKTDDFYKDIKGFSRFPNLTNPANYVPAPEEWYIVATDIMGSTKAIAEGRYKDVNLAGAATIMAVLNLAGNKSIPYAFGGDGTTMLIPPAMLEETRETLAGVRAKIKSAFDLNMRVGCVALRALYEQGAWLKVGKFSLSLNVGQAVFQGTALAMAETWLKQGGGPVLVCESDASDEPDLNGLECRWQPIENRNGEMISLLVRVTRAYESEAWRVYEDIFKEIEAIYPEKAQSFPTHTAGLNISFSPEALSKEVRIRAKNNPVSRLLYMLRILVINAIGKVSFVTKRTVGSFDGTRYLSEMVANSDAKKFDEMLRMVLDSTAEQHAALEKMLSAHQQRGEITYGIHVSSQALMTCLVFSLAGDHVHFIDGADGGYALAAKQMKQQNASPHPHAQP